MIAVVGARTRQVLARSPWILWAVIAALAVAAAALAMSAMQRIDDARAAWGDSRAVVVAATDIAPGAALAGLTRVEHLPGPLLPPAALGVVDPDAIARQAISAGEVVVAHDVAAADGPRALIPRGWLAVPVAEPVPSGAGPGDAVVVASGGVALAPDAVVVAADATRVLVAVPADAAPAVAEAAASAGVVLLLQP